ncbi:hypothetical protein BpHYR1_016868 [Brachionus plicatilis]|uniref:Uncharacterized protein n=1 Tax=Brachionus plicatilis TaxID=10195 RepID=A0A3M7P863_BRAPC|nr:hypothetical protein BpHYR1_016868 [Brachionus plicatilis]
MSLRLRYLDVAMMEQEPIRHMTQTRWCKKEWKIKKESSNDVRNFFENKQNIVIYYLPTVFYARIGCFYNWLNYVILLGLPSLDETNTKSKNVLSLGYSQIKEEKYSAVFKLKKKGNFGYLHCND